MGITENEKRENVIKGLECCTAELRTHQHQDDFCAVCPYKDKDPENWYCFHKQDLMRDSLALLKAQEPRVMTLEEVTEDCPVNIMRMKRQRHGTGGRTMADLISRAAAVRALASSNGDYLDALDRLEKIPAVDAAPVIHARWTTERKWKHDGEWYCSACDYEPVVFMDSTFCPNCGALMDGERRDSE